MIENRGFLKYILKIVTAANTLKSWKFECSSEVQIEKHITYSKIKIQKYTEIYDMIYKTIDQFLWKVRKIPNIHTVFLGEG